ncbi:uncharacterized protein LOC143185071 [Calliopsis andreniformis]|uniref:uncharacterized protein LOC143185071 n=1 Tax=Calliopsis andreniformis TaxID=337506 RepID=UPI003FCE0649
MCYFDFGKFTTSTRVTSKKYTNRCRQPNFPTDPLLEDEGKKFPLTTEVMQKGRYVDDTYGEADTINEAKQQALDVHKLCLAGGFPIRKWTSNHHLILDCVSTQYHSPTDSVFSQKNVIHALGLSWTITPETLHFNLSRSLFTQATKRAVLSTIAQFFNLLVLLSTIIVIAKTFLQELRALKLSWNDSLSNSQL